MTAIPGLNRRRMLAASAAGLTMAATPRAFGQSAYKAKADTYPTNPLGVRAIIYTIVTPDLAASIHFYRDIMGFELISQGKLEGRLPKMEGVGEPGRAYALIRTMEQGEEHGIVRLMAAPAGAKANRPRPGSNIVDPGYAVIECMSRSVDLSYETLTAQGAPTISGPRYYFFNDMKPLPGGPQEADFEIRSYSAFGPAGEQLFISSGVTRAHKPWPAWTHKGLHDGFVAGVLVSLDRWPVWDFYDAVLGLKPTRDTYSGSEAVNELIGAKPGSNCQFGMLGQGVSMEWWEYHDRPNPATPPFPTSLDRTGHAMTTMMVNDLGEVRARAKAAGYRSLGEGALPTPWAPYQDGFYLRGGVGELIEIIGRPV